MKEIYKIFKQIDTEHGFQLFNLYFSKFRRPNVKQNNNQTLYNSNSFLNVFFLIIIKFRSLCVIIERMRSFNWFIEQSLRLRHRPTFRSIRQATGQTSRQNKTIDT